MISSVIIAFSMYSRIPMPAVPFEKKNMKYIFGAFPLAGAAAGLLACACMLLFRHLAAGELLRGAVCGAAPFLVTGGIHMDGFMDTLDASASLDPARRREILKDHHCGAFAVMGCAMYLIMWTACFSQISGRWIYAAAFIFPISRIMSAFSVLYTVPASDEGTVYMLGQAADRRACSVMLTAEALLCAAGITYFSGLSYIAVPAALACAAIYCIYRRFAVKTFGGVSGDTSGFLLCAAELFLLLSAALLSAAGI